MIESETRNNAAVNFLGKVMREQPEIVVALSDRDRHILFCRSDIKNRRTFQELGDIYRITRHDTRRIYNRALGRVFGETKPSIQELTPLTVIFESVSAVSAETRDKMRDALRGRQFSPETHDKMKAAARRRMQDPEQKAHLVRLGEINRPKALSSESRRKRVDAMRGRRLPKETRKKIKRALQRRKNPDYQLWNYASKNGLVDLIFKKGLMPPRELDILVNLFRSGKPTNKLPALEENALIEFSKLVANLA